jgi:transcriptional regulator with XRE-family HTH domain
MKSARPPSVDGRLGARVEREPPRSTSSRRAAARSGGARVGGDDVSARQRDPDVRVLVTLLRRLHGWSQMEMAVRAAVHRSSVCLYESGAQVPLPGTVEKLAGAAGVPMWVVDGVLLPAIALARESSLATALTTVDGEVAFSALEDESAQVAARLGVARLFAALAERAEDEPAAAANPGVPGKDPWELLPACAQREPSVLAELGADFERLIECVCAASCRAAAHDPGSALALAGLALRLAALLPGEESRRLRAQAYVHGFLANALRVASDLPAAEAAFATAWKLRRLAGEGGASELLGEWRLLDLEASLRRDQRRFAAALDLLDRALALAPAAARGRVLLNEATTFEQAGQIEAALATLAAAAPLVDAAGEPRERMGVRFNTLVNLCHLGRHSEAEASLAELRQLVLELGNEQDLTRLGWLASRVAAGLGRREEALAGLATVQRDFRERGHAYNAALVSLDMAILYLEDGRTREVAALAGQMLWIFGAQGVHREALAALRLFREAAESDSLTAKLARRLRDYLERARHDPRPFAPPRRARGRFKGGRRPSPSGQG